jgi:hypothetical protein
MEFTIVVPTLFIVRSELKLPFIAIALGDTAVKKDVILAKVDHNRYAYLGNQYPVEVTVEAAQFKGQDAWCR